MGAGKRGGALIIARPETSPILLGLLAGASIAAAAGYLVIGYTLGEFAFNQGFGSYFARGLVAAAAAAAVLLVAPRLPSRGRLVSLAATLVLSAALLTAAPLLDGLTGANRRITAMVIIVAALVAQAAAAAFGVSAALEQGRGGARGASILAAIIPIATVAAWAGDVAAHRLNPDFSRTIAFCVIIEAAAVLAASVGLLWLLTAARSEAPQVAPSPVLAAWREIWRSPAARRMLLGYLLLTGLVAALDDVMYLLAEANGQPTLGTVQLWLPSAAMAAGLIAGGLLADRRKSRRGGLAAVALGGVGAGGLAYLFAITVDNPAQMAIAIAVAAGLCSLAWAPTLVQICDALSPSARPTGVALMAVVFGQLAITGLPHIVVAVVLKLVGVVSWAMHTGFWGAADIQQHSSTSSTGTSWRYILPLHFSIDLGDSQGTLHATRTAALLLMLCLAGPVALFRVAGVAAAPAGEAKAPQKPRVQAAVTVGALVAVIAVVGALCVDAQGLFRTRWTSAIVMKSSDAMDATTRDCKDWDCLAGVLKQNHASAQTLAFVKQAQGEGGVTSPGYPVAFSGKGKVKLVQFFQPGLGQAGTLAFLFVNGTKAAVLATDEGLEATAEANDQFRNIKAKFPQMMIWHELSYERELIGTDGAQSFVFQLPLLNGCHACDYLGNLEVAYDFDHRGHYTGLRVIGAKSDSRAAYQSVVSRLHDETGFAQTLTQVQPDGQVLSSPSQTSLIEKSHCRLAVYDKAQSFQGAAFTLENAFNIGEVAIQAGAMGNDLRISCVSGLPCISQDYSDERGRATPMPSWGLSVLPANVAATLQDFRTLQSICTG